MAKKTASSFNPIRTGIDPRKEKKAKDAETNNSNFLKLKPDTHADVTILVEPEDIVVCEQAAIWLDDGNSPVWVYSGPNDPSHELEIKRTYRAYLPVLTEEGEVKVWGMGKMAHTQVLEISDVVGELAGLVVRLKRTGAGLNTRYTLVSKGTRKAIEHIEEVDVVSMLGSLDPEEVKEMIAEKLGKSSYEEVVASYRGKKGIAKDAKSGKTKPITQEEDEEDEEIDDLELA